jgi:hypothetical protein
LNPNFRFTGFQEIRWALVYGAITVVIAGIFVIIGEVVQELLLIVA